MASNGEPFSENQSPGDVWGTGGDAGTTLGDTDTDTDAVDAVDVDCSPTRVCRNARDFTFDGIAEGGEEDLPSAWRRLLETEGKLSTGQPSIRDLVLGPPNGSVE